LVSDIEIERSLDRSTTVVRIQESEILHLSLNNIAKHYPGVKALDDVSFGVPYGKTIGLVGENGAGKSTLMDILCGLQKPDQGKLFLHGKSVIFESPKDATERGIFRVHQEQALISVYPVFQNLFLGLEDRYTRFGVLRFDDMRKQAHKVFKELGVNIEATSITGTLNFGARQLVEIARVIVQSELLQIEHPLVLLDEPTASLSGTELDLFYRIVDILKSRFHASIIFVSHRLQEVLNLCDQVLVLKDGTVVDENVADPTEAKLHKLMVGRERLKDFYATNDQREEFGAPVLKVEGLSSEAFRDVSFTVHQGEILGIGGLVQSGKTELGRAIFGVEKSSGSIEICGRNVAGAGSAERIQLGSGYIPLNRHQDGVMLGRSIADNIALPSLKMFARYEVIDWSKLDKFVDRQMAALRIKAPDAEVLVGNLSGGNQQKVVLAKWLARDPKLLVIDNPTRGVDAGAKEEIYKLLRHVADRGCGILLISDDLVELIEMSNRMFFLSSGQLSAEKAAPPNAKPREQDVVQLMF
jgi:ribose transport system ATP-binding protein